jgi:hypothetical protein
LTVRRSGGYSPVAGQLLEKPLALQATGERFPDASLDCSLSTLSLVDAFFDHLSARRALIGFIPSQKCFIFLIER